MISRANDSYEFGNVTCVIFCFYLASDDIFVFMSVDRVFLSYETRLQGAHVSTTERLRATTAPTSWWSLLQPLSVIPIMISHIIGSGLYLHLLKIRDSGF